MCGGKAVDALDDRTWPGDVAEAEVVVERVPVDLARHAGKRQEHFELGREGEAACELRQVERLDAEVVARAEQPAAGAIEDDEREHPVELVHHRLAVLLVEVHEDLGVRMVGREPVTARRRGARAAPAR